MRYSSSAEIDVPDAPFTKMASPTLTVPFVLMSERKFVLSVVSPERLRVTMRRDVGVWPAAHIRRVREVEGLPPCRQRRWRRLAGSPLFEPNKSLALPLPARQLIKPDAAAVHGRP